MSPLFLILPVLLAPLIGVSMTLVAAFLAALLFLSAEMPVQGLSEPFRSLGLVFVGLLSV